VYLVNTGKVRLGGNFRGARFICDQQTTSREVAA
jgi:hypothetical protein